MATKASTFSRRSMHAHVPYYLAFVGFISKRERESELMCATCVALNCIEYLVRVISWCVQK